MTVSFFFRVITAGSALAMPALAFAQTPFGQDAWMKVGRFALSPAITVGTTHDDNVLHEASDRKRDYSQSVLPEIEAELDGRFKLSMTAAFPFVRYGQYRTEGDAGARAEGRIDFPESARIATFLEGGYTRSKDREDGALLRRAPRENRTAAVGASLRLWAKTFIDARLSRNKVRYSDAVIASSVDPSGTDEEVDLEALLDEPLGLDVTGTSEQPTTVDAANALGQTQYAASVGIRRTLTPLTDLSVNYELQRDDFAADNVRSGDTTRVVIGLSSDAIINGSVEAGYAEFLPRDSSLPSYRGTVGSASIAHPILRGLGVAVQADRDIQFSFQPQQPYYVNTSVQVTLGYLIRNRIIVGVQARERQQDYRAIEGSGLANERDRESTYGLDVRYGFNRNLSIAVAGVRERRRSAETRPSYVASRVTTSLRYTF